MNKKTVTIGLICLLVVVAIGLVTLRFSNRISSMLGKSETVGSIVKKYEETVVDRLRQNFVDSGIDYGKARIAILAFKSERRLEVYAKNEASEKWQKFKTYEFTGFSGTIGPKLKEGDRQIPEGVYSVESLNPNSSYHLSLRVNYPNEFDKNKGKLDGRKKLGGDIMIHGRSATVGCIPIGDENIEELFVLAAKSYKFGIPVILAPSDFRKDEAPPEDINVEWKDELYKAIREELKNYS